jgi:RNA polymerase sigma factor (TIGR02999 family)
MRRQPAGHTLQTTALAHEAWLRLGAPKGGPPQDPRDFARVASRVMRSILVDHARARRTLKRGGGRPRLPLEEADAGEDPSGDVLLVHDALERLEASDPVLARLVELRFFGGLDVKEAALLLGVSLRTAHRMWEHARAWLYRDIHP